MNEQTRSLLEAKRRELSMKAYFNKFKSISFIDLEEENSIWHKKFYSELRRYNNIYSIPDITKPLVLTENEIIQWILSFLTMFHEEMEFLLPVNNRLANVTVKSFETAFSELWKSDANLGVNITMASKKQKMIFHIFEAEYEYEIYINAL